MLDAARKVLVKLIRTRLTEATRAAGDLSPDQFGVSPGRFTVDAVIQVMDVVHRTKAHSHQARWVVLPVTLGVRNAFNSER